MSVAIVARANDGEWYARLQLPCSEDAPHSRSASIKRGVPAGRVVAMSSLLTSDQDSVLRAYAAAVRSSPHNLVSKRARTELWERHVAESVAFAATLPRDAVLLDVGSGGGFPGFVVAVTRPDIHVTLLDSSTKKVAFLVDTAAGLGVSVDVLHGRAEEIRTAEGASRFTVVSARAVAPFERLLGWTMPFLVPGGLLYAIKGENWERELDAATAELVRWQGEVVATPADVPPKGDEPMVVVIRRGGMT